MKLIIAVAFMIFSISLSAAEYQCFSYNSHNQILANLDTGTIIIKDRFGNELNVILEAEIKQNILGTLPETLEVQFLKHGIIVLQVFEQMDFIHAVYAEDESIHCRIQ